MEGYVDMNTIVFKRLTSEEKQNVTGGAEYNVYIKEKEDDQSIIRPHPECVFDPCP
jgi:hypothetical protein